MNKKILLVEDQQSSRQLLASFLEDEGYTVSAFENAEVALEAFEKETYSCALLDIRLPGMDGVELLKKLREIDPDFIAIFMTAFGSVEIAVEGMSVGAFSFIQKPVNLKQVLNLVEAAVEENAVEQENVIVRQELQRDIPINVIAESRGMKDVFSRIANIAPTDVPVLIYGESGTGKEIVARAIHNSSLRTSNSFIALNCAALPENLVESEIFGYEQGAFSGAKSRKKGMAEMADGGTLFLDEIGDFPIALQPKLLRMLEDSGFYRVGGTELVRPDIRVIAATNKDLTKMSEQGSFREDLYFRLKGISVVIPPLSKRPEDILALSESFLKKFSKKYKRDVIGFTEETRAALLRYKWPGNVRELLHSVESAVVVCRKRQITVKDLQINIDENEITSSAFDINTPLAVVEKAHIEAVLTFYDWNISKASSVLGIHRNTLSSKIKEFELKNE